MQHGPASAVLPVCRAQGAGCQPPETVTGTFLWKGWRTWGKLPSPSLPFQTGWVKQQFIGAVFTWASSGGICRTGTVNWNSPAWAFPPCVFAPSLLLPIENSSSAMTAFKHITWQIMPMWILHALCRNFILSAAIPHRIANSVPVGLFRIFQHLGVLNHCQ